MRLCIEHRVILLYGLRDSQTRDSKGAAMKPGYKQGGMVAAGALMPQEKHRKGHPVLGAERATKRREDHFTEVLAYTAAPGTKDFLKKACMELGMRVGSRANASL